MDFGLNQFSFEMIPAYAPLLEDWRYVVLYGGRGAGRSVAAMQSALYFASKVNMRIIVVREFQNSIEESAKAQIEELILKYGMEGDWDIQRTRLINKKTGAVFLFMGLARNYTKVKSIPNIDLVILEESETISAESLQVLIPTIRKTGSSLWFLGNPQLRTAAVAQMFFENEPPPRTKIIRTTYLDNPFCSAEFIAEAEHLRKTDPALYDHVYMGNYIDRAVLRMVPYYVVDDGHTIVDKDDVAICGVDIARDGEDSTVICVRKGKKILFISAYKNMDSDKLTAELLAVHLKYDCERYNLDTTGFGSYAQDAPRKAGLKVIAVNFSENANRDDRYSNVRTELYGRAREYFDGGGTIPKGSTKLQEELECSPYTLDRRNRMAMIPKKDIKKLLHRSPDRADAFVLSLYGPNGSVFARNVMQINRTVRNRALLDGGSYGGKFV